MLHIGVGAVGVLRAMGMRSSRVVTVERLNANAAAATVLGSIPASSDTVESEGWQMKLC